MSVIAVGSAKASPGVSTIAVAMAAVWPPDRNVLLVEADPDGGVLASRYGLAAEPGLSTLAVSGRRGMPVADVVQHTQPVSEAGVSALVAPPTAEQARRALDLAAPPLAEVLPRLSGVDVVIDVGRLRPGSEAWPLVEGADAVLLVARPQLDEIQQLPARLRALRTAVPQVGLLLVGTGAYAPAEVAAALAVEVVAVVADDPRTAALLAGRSRGRVQGRSPLMRSVRSTVDAVLAWLPAPTSPQPEPEPGADDAALGVNLADSEVAP